MQGLTPDKTQDESRQGEALLATSGDRVYHKYFYIES